MPDTHPWDDYVQVGPFQDIDLHNVGPAPVDPPPIVDEDAEALP